MRLLTYLLSTVIIRVDASYQVAAWFLPLVTDVTVIWTPLQ